MSVDLDILDPAEKAFHRRWEENRRRLTRRFTEARIKQSTNNFENKIGSSGVLNVSNG